MPKKNNEPITSPFFAYLSDIVSNQGTARGGEKIYHGSDLEGLEGIEKEGFRKSQQGWYGKGVYTSHDDWTAEGFSKSSKPIQGELPPGFKYKTVQATLGGDTLTTNDFLRLIGIPEDQIPQRKDYSFYDIRDDLKYRFPGYDGLRMEGLNEPQLLIFDEKNANAAFPSAGGEKVGPRKSMLYPPKEKLNNRQKLAKGLVGLANAKSFGTLSNTFAAAEGGKSLADLVMMISEMMYGRMPPAKYDESKKKIK